MKAKRLIALVLGVIMAVTMLASCGSKNDSTTDKGQDQKDKFSFAFLANTQNNTFQSTMNDTFKKLADEKGYDYVCYDPDYDLNKQLGQMSDAATQKFDVVFVIPVDSAGIRSGLKELNDSGAIVINVDTTVIDADRDLVKTLVATNAYMAGKLEGEQMVKDYPNGAKIAILDFPENESCVARVNGFLEGLGDSKDKFTIVAQQDGKAALDASLKLAEDIIQANPDLQAFFCINDPSALGAASGVKAGIKTGQIGVYSIDASPDGKQALVDGDFTSVAAQVPIKISEKAFELSLKLLDGGSVEKEYYLDSILVTVDMAKETLNDWQ